jgi:hypothetical protein
MSGMLGAMAIASVSARRHAEGSGAAATGSAGLSLGAGVRFPSAAALGSAAGASAGRGLGNGTNTCTGARSAARRGFCQPTLNRSLRGSGLECRAAAGPDCAHSINNTATAVTIGASMRPEPPQGHLRRSVPALKFPPIAESAIGKAADRFCIRARSGLPSWRMIFSPNRSAFGGSCGRE